MRYSLLRIRLYERQRPRPIGRSVGALLAGFLFVVRLSIGTHLARPATGVFPLLGRPMNEVLFLLATAYRTIFGAAGSYVMARLAPDRPMLPALRV